MLQTAPRNEHVDVLEMNQAFDDVDGHFQFTGTLVVYRRANDVYHTVSKARYSCSSGVQAGHLTNNISIPLAAYSPPFPTHFTCAPEPLPRDFYVKKPRLISYDRIRQGPRPNHIADSFLAEAEVCEVLKRHPHPNIATYLGCQVSDGRIIGICFAKYHRTLMQTVNPSNIMLYNDTAVIIDFGSCRRQGEDLEGVGRTYEWYDEAVQVAIPENDFN